MPNASSSCLLLLIIGANVLFAAPLAYAYLSGLEAARAPEARVTPASPFLFFRRRVRRYLRWWKWVWAIVLAACLFGGFGIGHWAAKSRSYDRILGIGICGEYQAGNLKITTDNIYLGKNLHLPRKVLCGLVAAGQLAIITVVNWGLIYAALILIAPRFQTPMWLIVFILLAVTAACYGIARANPYYGTAIVLMPATKRVLATWLNFRFNSNGSGYHIALHYFYFLPLSLAFAFAASSWRRFWARDHWFRFET